MQFNVLKNIIFSIISDLQGKDIICLDVRKKTSITDTMIMCTGISNRHVISIAQDMLRKFRDIGLKPYGLEGINVGEWILIDLENIIIHIMTKEMRKLYALEQLWT